ncbi:MAG: phosphate acyltransferase PlsX [Solirubrobacterales bacterium]
MKIVIDGMGGDYAPDAVIEGCFSALKEINDIEIIITGDESILKEKLAKYNYKNEKISIVDAKEVISTNEAPVMAVRKKKDSSLVKALYMVKNGEADAFISAGSTGAIMAGASFILGRIKGIDRVALAPVMPGKNAPFMIVDAGANVDCKPTFLYQFAILGKVYYENVLNTKNPTIGLVNIGAEEEKGNELTKETYQLLKNSGFNFVGNVEPREVTNGDVNILVCDGFLGNTLIKMYEGVAMNIFSMLKSEIKSSLFSKIGGIFLMPGLKNFKKKFDYTEYGGSAFLGTKGICIKAHGSSNAKAFKNAIKQAKVCYDNQVITKIQHELEGNL